MPGCSPIMRGLILVLFLLCPAFVFGQDSEGLGKLHLIYIGQTSDPQLQWFATNPELAQLKKSVTWSHLRPSDKIFIERYQPVLGNDFPMVIFERADGGTIYAASGRSMPRYGSDLFAMLRESYQLAKNAAQPVKTEDLLYESPPCVGPFCPAPDTSSVPSVDRDRVLPLRKDPFPAESIIDRASNLVWLVFALGAFGFTCFVLLITVWLVSIFMRSP